ncbi:hypothetical protein BASA61_007755 [Batrachochytrium salamandrivorans]|nr:hypothetical protein BASA60_001230 [Batrachochytrium salamandrivorans]KAH6583993.1 hypothetical protein BASA61_007755 [Batrachochytrium salamandrivorans]
MQLPPFPSLVLPPTTTSSVKRIFLCRHGQTEPNALGVLQGSGIDEYLNDMGVQQAQHLRDRLGSIPVDLIVSSKLKRAYQTAEIVKERHPDAAFLQVSELAEISWGDWEGQVEPQLKSLLNAWMTGDFHSKAPNGESPSEVEARAVPAFYHLLLNRPEKTIVFVVHGRLLRIMLSSFLFHNLRYMNDFTHHNTCINLIDAILETDPVAIGDKANVDMSKLKLQLNTSSRRTALDDNVALSETPSVQIPPELSTAPLASLESGSFPLVSNIAHPRNLTLVPLLLDDRSHLPPSLE